jgi:hypothetical protein
LFWSVGMAIHCGFFVWLKGHFYFQDFYLILFTEVFHIFVQLLFYIFCFTFNSFISFL